MMYLSSRAWGVQPSEFWDMTLGEWLLEANYHWENSEAGKLEEKRVTWEADAKLTKEEWYKKHGIETD